MTRSNHYFQIIKVTGNLLIAVFVLISNSVFSQGVAVNTTGISSDPSAMLDVSSSNAGILIPRMTEAQKNLIVSPATGLMIYQTDATTGFWYYDGSAWVQSIGPKGATGADGVDGATGPTGPTGPAGTSGLLSPGTSAGNTPYWDGTQWVVNSSNIFNNGGSVGIGTNNPDNSAILDLQSTTKGFVIPRMTTAERNAINAPTQGLQIFNITSNCLEIFISPIWQTVYCGCNLPASPVSGTHVPSQTEIIWNWNASSGATGYKYNTVNDYNTASDIGTSTTYTQTALSCNTSYVLYVWAYSNCGNLTSTALTQSTSACFVCGNNVSVSHVAGSISPVNKSVDYGTVLTSLSGSSKCWINKNLGATNQPTSISDASEAAAGWYWQFNSAQGYKYDGSRVPSSTWPTSINENSDWLLANDPCYLLLGNDWRIPTYTEINNVDVNGNWTSGAATYSSVLKLHYNGLLTPVLCNGSPTVKFPF